MPKINPQDLVAVILSKLHFGDLGIAMAWINKYAKAVRVYNGENTLENLTRVNELEKRLKGFIK